MLKISNISKTDENKSNLSLVKIIDMEQYSKRIFNIIKSKYIQIFLKILYDEYELKIKEKITKTIPKNRYKKPSWFYIYKKIFLSKKINRPINPMIFTYLEYKAKTELNFLYHEANHFHKFSKDFIDLYIIKMKEIHMKYVSRIRKKKGINIPELINLNVYKRMRTRNLFNSKHLKTLRLPTQIKITQEQIEEQKSFKLMQQDIIEHIKKIKEKLTFKYSSLSEIKRIRLGKKFKNVQSRYLNYFYNNKNNKTLANNNKNIKNNFDKKNRSEIIYEEFKKLYYKKNNNNSNNNLITNNQNSFLSFHNNKSFFNKNLFHKNYNFLNKNFNNLSPIKTDFVIKPYNHNNNKKNQIKKKIFINNFFVTEMNNQNNNNLSNNNNNNKSLKKNKFIFFSPKKINTFNNYNNNNSKIFYKNFYNRNHDHKNINNNNKYKVLSRTNNQTTTNSFFSSKDLYYNKVK